MASAAGEAIGVSYLMTPTRPQLLALRLPSPGIYICGPPRLRPSAPTAACALSDRSIAFYVVFLDALWHPPHLRFSANTDSYGSRSAARVEANGIACRALLPSPLRCRKRTVCGSGAFSASPCSPSHISCCAGRSDYVTCDFLAGQFMPSARHSARSASRACALA